MRALRTDTRGVALIEFALVVPVLVLLFVGGYQLSDAVFAYRKVTRTARMVADVVSQYTQVNDADLDMILNASEQVLAPYPVAQAELRVSQVTIDPAGVARVTWSRAKNTTPLAVDAPFAVPAAYRQNDTTTVIAEVRYKYSPVFASTMIGPITLQEQVTMYPRKSASIARN